MVVILHNGYNMMHLLYRMLLYELPINKFKIIILCFLIFLKEYELN